MERPRRADDDGAVTEALRVHVIVDHVTMRELLTDLLVREHGCTVTSKEPTAGSARELQLQAGDVLLIDQRAFDQAVWRLAAARSGAFVLVVAVEDDPSSQEAALAQGAHAWLPRERLAEELGREIRRVLAGSVSPSRFS